MSRISLLSFIVQAFARLLVGDGQGGRDDGSKDLEILVPRARAWVGRPGRPPNVAAGGSVSDAADLVGTRPSTAKRHLADLRAKSGLSTAQLIDAGRAAGWLAIPSLEPL